MIGVEKASRLVLEHTKILENNGINLSKAYNYYLAESIFSPIQLPPFRQSAMDGYALNLSEDIKYKVIGEIKAGDAHHPTLEKGQAVRIYTGAPVPNSANAVVMQEQVTVDDKIIFLDGPARRGENIRPLGEQVKKGALALEKGTRLTPAAIGYLASLGITEVEVYKKPTIAIVVTGNELVEAGQDLTYGKIYESNAIMLRSALDNYGYSNVSIHTVQDDFQNTCDLLKKVITNSDVVLVTGGISVGDYDFVGKALQELSVKELFYKVKQKPGKPLFFGKKEDTSVFALPGNPAAALSCFYIYVYPTLQKMSGNPNPGLRRTVVRSNSNYTRKGDRAQFLKALVDDDQATILEGQSSAMLQTFALANAFVYMPLEQGDISVGDMAEVIHLP